jgi:hypothetical protein
MDIKLSISKNNLELVKKSLSTSDSIKIKTNIFVGNSIELLKKII